jgi:CRISPR-associated protein Cas1
MRIKDLHLLPKFRDCMSYLYLEHCKIEQEHLAVAAVSVLGKIPIPCAGLSVLMLGPGTSITHAAIKILGDCGCLILWCGEDGMRFYAVGSARTRSSKALLRQATAWADPDEHMKVVRRMYEMRFDMPVDPALTLQQVRGCEGVRVREAYGYESRVSGVPWDGRNYKPGEWGAASPINRALSAANACMYGVCQAGICSLGLSPALGFVHTGKALSFVYDIADIFKTDISIPAAFTAAKEGEHGVEKRAREHVRDLAREKKLLPRTVTALQSLLELDKVPLEEFELDEAEPPPAQLWGDDGHNVPGGENYGGDDT